MGVHLAEATHRALESGDSVDDPAVAHSYREVELQNSNWRYHLLQRLKIVTLGDADPKGQTVRTEVHSVSIGPVGILTAPGEVSPELAERYHALIEQPHRMLFCLCGDEFGYILDPSQFEDKEYSYEQSMSLGQPTADVLMGSYKELVRA